MIRLLFILVLAALEAAAVSLPLAVFGFTWAWPLLLGIVLLGWLTDQLALRLSAVFQPPALLAGALVAAAFLVRILLDANPLLALLPGAPRLLEAYLALLLALFVFWRGTRLDLRDSGAVRALFSQGAWLAVASLLLGALGGGGASLSAPGIVGQVVGLVALGLLALALAHAQETAGGRLQQLSWRWLLTLVAAIGLVVALALGGLAVAGWGETAAAAQNLLRLLLLPLALIGGAIAWLLYQLMVGPLLAAIQAMLARLRELQPQPSEQIEDAQTLSTALETIERLASSATYLLALIPIAILVLAILVLRRRQRPAARPDEERESLGLFSSLGDDLRDLLRGLKNPFARQIPGLRAALAALVGADPSTRARRAYVRLLLLLEGRDRRRDPAQTPAEFVPAAAAATGAPEPVARLTGAYEAARYNPAGVSEAAAQAAEAALRTLDGDRQ